MKHKVFYRKRPDGYAMSTEYTDERVFFGRTLEQAAKNFEEFYGIRNHEDVEYCEVKHSW